MTECADSQNKQHDFESHWDHVDSSIHNGVSWEVRRCRHCGHELTQCGCGAWFEPISDDGEDLDCCASCQESRDEAAYERQQEEGFRGGEYAGWLAVEQDRVRRELK